MTDRSHGENLERRNGSTRRRFLASTVLAGAGLGVLGRAAWGLSLEPAPAATAELYFEAKKACGERAYHAQLVAEVDALLKGRQVSDEERQAAIDALRCPLCGCPPADA